MDLKQIQNLNYFISHQDHYNQIYSSKFNKNVEKVLSYQEHLQQLQKEKEMKLLDELVKKEQKEQMYSEVVMPWLGLRGQLEHAGRQNQETETPECDEAEQERSDPEQTLAADWGIPAETQGETAKDLGTSGKCPDEGQLSQTEDRGNDPAEGVEDQQHKKQGEGGQAEYFQRKG